ncbi:MAG: hypothetical protein WC712_04140 [Candidatus Brocadiia bacterium]
MSVLQKLLTINPRYVYLVVAVAVIFPMVWDLRLPTVTSPPVEMLYKEIESLPPQSRIILSMDYDPSTVPELHPMSAALLRQCFAKGIRVFGMTLNIQGQSLGVEIMDRIAKEFNIPNDGSQYVFVGFRPGPVIIQIGEDIIETFQTDFQKRDLRSLPMMVGVKNLDQFELCISLSGTSVGYSWIATPGTRYRKKIAVGVTGILVSNFYPYLQSGQLVGMLGGLKGAAEYENLIQHEDKAKQGMGSQSAAHILIILLIIAGNIIYFVQRRQAESK